MGDRSVLFPVALYGDAMSSELTMLWVSLLWSDPNNQASFCKRGLGKWWCSQDSAFPKGTNGFCFFLKEIQMTSYVVSLWFLYISCLGIQPSRGCFIKINTRIAWEDNFSYGLPYGVTLGHCFNYIHSSGKDPSTCGQQHSLGRRWLMVNYREKVSTGKQAYIPLSLLLVVDVISCLRLLPP